MANSGNFIAPVNRNIIENFISDSELSYSVNKLKDGLSDNAFNLVNLILRRLKLAENIGTGELFNHVNFSVGSYEESALKLHLIITCIELSSKFRSDEEHIHFLDWLNKKKKEGFDITQPDGSTNSEVAKSFFECYNKTYGVNTQYKYFFMKGLNRKDQDWLLSLCWCWKSKKMEYMPMLGFYLEQEQSSTTNFEPVVCFNKWKSFDRDKKVKMIASTVYSCRNAYTHSLRPYTSANDSVHKMVPEFLSGQEININRGDVIHLVENNIGIASNKIPLTELISECINRVLKNYITKTLG